MPCISFSSSRIESGLLCLVDHLGVCINQPDDIYVTVATTGTGMLTFCDGSAAATLED